MQPFTNIRALIIDMDGVLWHGTKPIPGLTEFFQTLHELQIRFILATNNASLTPEQYVTKLARMGVTVTQNQILTSGIATALYLSEHVNPAETRVFVVGEDGATQPLIDRGFTLTGLYEVNNSNDPVKKGADIVVCGKDETLTWAKLATATLNIRAGAKFIGTNADTTLPTEHGLTHGNGAILAALEVATGVTPTIIGKPEPIIYQQALTLLGVDPDETVAIGDRLETDILGAVRTGIRSIMVLTGVSTEDDLKEANYLPTWVMPDIRAVTQALRSQLICTPYNNKSTSGAAIMKKFINSIDTLLDESLLGFSKAHADIIQLNAQPHFIKRINPPKPGKVALISGGGSGHEPLHIGFVGSGMLDAACPGQIFTSPTPDQMLAAAQAVENGGGVLFIVKNYAGDVMNFEISAEMLDCPNASVLVSDDVSLPKSHSTGRRGVAGTLIVEKIVGAAAEKGANLATCKALGDKVNHATASMGVALSSCTVPALGKPTFDISDTEMEMGVGIHGERGRETLPLSSATEIVEHLAGIIDDELKPKKGQPVLLHVNGFGATPLMELHLIYGLAAQFWEKRGINIARSLVGNYTTSIDMAGCSITLSLLDEELLGLWDAPVHTASLRWGC